jgi:predicted metalloendopeptidase
LTAEQRFFMAWARAWRRNYTDAYLRLLINSDPHSPSHLRCEAPMSNMPSFSDAFGLPENSSQMRPEASRVDIW